MAEKKEEEIVEAPEGKKSSSMMLIIIIVVLILVILIGAVVTILMMGGDSKSEEKASKASKATEKTEKVAGEKKPTPGAESSRTLDKIGILLPLDTFTVNLMSESGSRYLKATISLELSGKELTEELEAKKPVIRDKILRLLSSKSIEEVSTLKGKDQLSEQIMQQLNPMLKDGSINGVYFTDFVIQ